MEDTRAAGVRSRECGTCTQCCKLLAVKEIDKPAGTPCRHCEEGRGCQIYSTRPKACRAFNCYFLTNPKLREEWRPSKSRIVLVVDPDGQCIAAYVDPERPGAWRREPFYSMLKSWAKDALSRPGQMGQVLVCIGKRTFVIFPDRNVDMGEVESDEIVVTRASPGPRGVELQALKMKRNDPQASSIPIAGEMDKGTQKIF